MDRAIQKLSITALFVALGAVAMAAGTNGPKLSTAETAIISKQIATLRSPADRHVAESWSDAKKVAELICRPAALPVLRKRVKTTDRVFLGTDAPETLTLESNSRLTGTGQFRTSQGWRDFTFSCEMDPGTGEVTAFHPVFVSLP